MSDAYEDDLAAEEELFERIAAAEARHHQTAPVTQPTRSEGGRPPKVDPIKLVAWRQAHNATVAETAKRWRVSEPTVKRLSRVHGEAAKAERERYQQKQLDKELAAHEYEYRIMFAGQRNARLSWVSLEWFGRTEAAKGTDQEVTVEAAFAAALDKADREFREDWARCMGPVPE